MYKKCHTIPKPTGHIIGHEQMGAWYGTLDGVKEGQAQFPYASSYKKRMHN